MKPIEKAKKSKSFCIYPWIHQYVGPPGDIKPCCVYLQDKQLGSLKENTLKEIWNNEETKNIRQQMLNGIEPEGCYLCSSRNYFAKTHRDVANELYLDDETSKIVNTTKEDGTVEEHRLLYIDARFNNLCNLKCRTCGPRFSSSWVEDHAKLHDLTLEQRGFNTFQFAGSTETQLIDEILPHLGHVKGIYFAGGEPLMQVEHYRILEELIRLRHFGTPDKPLSINYNTNLTSFKLGKYNVLDFWKHFNGLRINASLDGSYERAEYWRKGCDWSEIVSNRIRMKEECPNVKFAINYTVSWVNVFNMFDLHKEWVGKELLDINNLNTNILEVPTHLSLKNIPHWKKQKIEVALDSHIQWLKQNNTKEYVVDKFYDVKNFMYSIDTSKSDFVFDTEFYKRTHKLDVIRSENFWNIFPEHLDMKEYLNV